ncbi:hypothetical protein F4820DRAFT_469316 [Hypoxylon rubiginosum]|uniref:Uncharacterized protein n=1 Tax=Hypoxylon rubiginosum TaxID=110542 RepID=A0ACB9Z345_9PEZI|nr:hypothetical protein F4820DRAFT_469316 [Hypoxylon rubiginosum]
MAFAPNKPPKRSRRLPREIEDELKVGFFDSGDSSDAVMPQLIIGNGESCCHGVYYQKPDGPEFAFHHAKGVYNTTCGCLIECKPDDETLQLPAELELHRLKLMFRGPYKMEPKFAAMVVMKLFLGMEVPEQLRIQPRETAENAEPEQQGEQKTTESSE